MNTTKLYKLERISVYEFDENIGIEYSKFIV